jgi:hypothetical protein
MSSVLQVLSSELNEKETFTGFHRIWNFNDVKTVPKFPSHIFLEISKIWREFDKSRDILRKSHKKARLECAN